MLGYLNFERSTRIVDKVIVDNQISQKFTQMGVHEGSPSLFFNQPVEFTDQTVDFGFETEDSVPVVVMILPLVV